MNKRTLLGVDLGGTNVRAGLVQDNGLEQTRTKRINANGSILEVVEEIAGLIDTLFGPEVSGLGVGVPSPVDLERGIVYDTVNIPSWTEVPLKALLEERYHVPVFLNNDANCFALGEFHFGKARGYKNAVGIVLGTGLGAGIVLNGQICSGGHCGAGEFGMIPFRDGVVENYASGQFFRRCHGVSGETLAVQAKASDSAALQIFEEYGSILGEAVMMVMYAVDPDMIVLGGSVSESFRYFEKSLRESLHRFVYQRAARALKIEVSEIDQIAILGAAALCL
jgi:glucokinase